MMLQLTQRVEDVPAPIVGCWTCNPWSNYRSPASALHSPELGSCAVPWWRVPAFLSVSCIIQVEDLQMTSDWFPFQRKVWVSVIFSQVHLFLWVLFCSIVFLLFLTLCLFPTASPATSVLVPDSGAVEWHRLLNQLPQSHKV